MKNSFKRKIYHMRYRINQKQRHFWLILARPELDDFLGVNWFHFCLDRYGKKLEKAVSLLAKLGWA